MSPEDRGVIAELFTRYARAVDRCLRKSTGGQHRAEAGAVFHGVPRLLEGEKRDARIRDECEDADRPKDAAQFPSLVVHRGE